MTFEELYEMMKAYFQQKDFSGFGEGVYSFQFIVSGESAGIFFMEVRDGIPDIEPYDYKNCRCSFLLDAGVLRCILDRRLSPVEAYVTGRLTVHGDVSAAFLLADALGLSL